MEETTPLLNQSHRLPRRRLLLVFPALALIQFTSFLDQTAISTSLPAIAAGLKTGASISLVNASFLITSTSIQLINGRLSDIFGRKACLATALAIMGTGNLISGFCTTPMALFIARALTGFGAGAINALVQIAIADITTLEQRGYYFGLVGCAVALGNGLGPAIGGVLTQHLGWPWAFWVVSPITVIAIIYLLLVWPSSHGTDSSRQMWAKLKLVDWFGAWTSLAAITLFLVPISQGGSTFAWDSPLIITMLVASGLLFVLFFGVEWHWAQLPMLPFHLFQYGRSTNLLIFVNVFIGWIFWGNLFVLPLYLQNIRSMSPGQAGVMILPMVIAHGICSAGSGLLISLCGHYKPIVVAGATCWMVAAVVKLWYGQTTPIWTFAVIGILDGVGVGCSLQPVLVGLFAGTDPVDRAVLTGLRNFLRDMGGAVGVTISGSILTNILSKQLAHTFSPRIIAQLTSSAFALEELQLSAKDRQLVADGYMNGLHSVFASYAVLIALYLGAVLWIKDYGLHRGQGITGKENPSGNAPAAQDGDARG
ncbi:Major facilitator superfamily domain general substrate transporter [Penicillium capsulatum]|uniref:Major facilitator superfamily domain general substrate transporter n=1 Tax=Penicillium capsulatum TaxID=69766 RepID=A0A9W9I342_9EURO|nr:Major facilitator superfamily domain general substrate transporter [Penicillium capsulatum]KAJ6117724.1 Major facilitator superfamily domain general substrate transporter [Penicillium capsulatum]